MSTKRPVGQRTRRPSNQWAKRLISPTTSQPNDLSAIRPVSQTSFSRMTVTQWKERKNGKGRLYITVFSTCQDFAPLGNSSFQVLTVRLLTYRDLDFQDFDPNSYWLSKHGTLASKVRSFRVKSRPVISAMCAARRRKDCSAEKIPVAFIGEPQMLKESFRLIQLARSEIV
ncbi:hypothetical protein M513_12867 [Trichuris suis]|uniref:Uncharacterized protein n=1 Tax=Trichuris suis TaxID=68888 RepID=A0A085LMQ3_9BILA|nr:hypothetical protein M513_12867 [Trichuris suis]